MCKSNCVWNKKNNADLKAYSVPADVNPGLENCINKLITQYFCTCVIPFVMLKRTVGGERRDAGIQGIKVCCVVGLMKSEWDFAENFIVPIVYMHLVTCVCYVRVPASIFNARVFCVFPRRATRGVLFLHIRVVTVIVFHSPATRCFCDSSSRHRD